MQALPTRVDTRSETYRTNREGFLEQITYLNEQLAINFVVKGLLGDGVAASLRSDPQAKSLGEYLRAKLVAIPSSLLEGG